MRRAVIATMLVIFPAGARAQRDASNIGPALLSSPSVRAALDAVRRDESQVLEDQERLCEIPAPPFREAARAGAVKTIFEALGLRNVHYDAVGNVLGERPGREPRPRLVIASHLDTVFGEGTDVTVRHDGDLLKGPGIGDNCRGLAALIGVARVLQQTHIDTEGPITFVADVGEESVGNLRGAEHLLTTELRGQVDRFVSIDGSGTGFTHVGVGSHRYRVTFQGPGGHSYYQFGIANPAHAMGRAMAAIADFDVPADPKTTFNVGRLGGGTSINAIPDEVWMEIDLRSHDAAALDAIDADLKRAVRDAVEAENARWAPHGEVTAVWESIGPRAPGVTPQDSPIVEATVSVTRALGLAVRTVPGTTDSNVAMALGIPAVTIDGGGTGSGGHSVREVFDATDSWKGTQRALLLAIALATP